MADPYREPTEGGTAEPRIEKPSEPEMTEKTEKMAEMPKTAPAEEALKPTPSPSAIPAVPAQAAAPASQVLQTEKDRQLKMLVDLAFSQGIDKAVEAVNATSDAYLIDKFHDTLIDELRQQLVEKGKLKEV
ncbi:MAG: hypothetical protein V1845_02615 [bacterium]